MAFGLLCACTASEPQSFASPDAGVEGRDMDAGVDAAPTDASTVFDAALDAMAEPSAPRFVDVTERAGLGYRQAPPHGGESDWYAEHGLRDWSAAQTGGAAAGDYDGDGWIDLYVTRLDDHGLLFRNLGDGTFADVTSQVGLDSGTFGSGAAFGDVDNDGDVDLLVTTFGGSRHALWINRGGRFEDEALSRGVALVKPGIREGYSVSFGDYDRDGWLDAHLCEWTGADLGPPLDSHGRLLRNRGSEGATLAGVFEDVTVAAGVVVFDPMQPDVGSFTSNFADFDADGWPDLAVVADHGTSRLFWNRGDGSFEEGTASAGVGTDEAGMGSAIGDYDGDGRLDWFVSSISCENGCELSVDYTGNRLYRYAGRRRFVDFTDEAGVRHGQWAWGSTFVDIDNDADLDLVQANGIRVEGAEFDQFRDDPMHVWINRGDGRMEDFAEDMGVEDRDDGKGLLTFDYDNDGDPDLFVVNHVDGGRLYENDGGNRRDWVRLRLRGRASNRQGVGARVELTTDDGRVQLRELRAGNNFLGQNETVVHFGLGERRVERVEILWPTPGDRKRQILTDVEVNRLLVVEEPD